MTFDQLAYTYNFFVPILKETESNISIENKKTQLPILKLMSY